MIDTPRLVLRSWRDDDREPFAEMGRDPEVMANLGPLMTREQSDAGIERIRAHDRDHGFCFWAIEERATGRFLGFCGIKPGVPDSPIAGDIEIGWRLRRDAWGQGYAKEAALAALAWGFANRPVPRIVAITVRDNVRSWGLMERLGMTRRDDLAFDHPLLAEGDRLRPHITYVMERPASPTPH
jgi:RimJ/RimL family protein N-acetyltransferase